MPLASPTKIARSRELCACLLAVGAIAWADCAAWARTVEIAIFYTTDLHGHVLPTTDYEGRRDVGGLLRCSTRIGELRAKHPHHLLLDCGDLYQGSAESYLTDGAIMIRALEWLRYDAWILGNHEFDWGLQKMRRLLDASSIPMLAANLIARPARPHPFPRVAPFLVKEIDGVKVAVVGLITPGVPTWSTPDLLGDAVFERSVAALQRIMPLVRAAEPDVLILATHQGFKRQGDDHANEINAIAKAFPELDAIIGGHSHQPIPEEWVNGKTLYTQAGYYGVWLGQLDLTYDTVSRRVIHKSARLHEMTDAVPRDKALETLLGPDLKRAEAYLAREIGSASARIAWEPDEYGRSPVQALLARAIASASGADMVLHGILDEEALEPGVIRMADLWRIVPYENRIALLQVTPAELLDILRENAASRGALSFMGLFGGRYRFDVDQSGARIPIGLALADGTTPHPRLRIKLAVNSYVVASGGGRYKRLREIAERPETRMRILDLDTRGVVLDYIRHHSPLDPVRLMETP